LGAEIGKPSLRLAWAIEVARKRPSKPINQTTNDGVQRLRQIMRVVKMVRHDPSMSEDAFHQPNAADPAESATDKFRAQLHSSRRLIEYYDQVVAEIRASLDRAPKGSEAS